MATSKKKKTQPLQVNVEGTLQAAEPTMEPLTTPPFSLDFNFGLGIRTIVLPNGMDVLTIARIYTDLLDKYEVKYEIIDKPII